MKLITFKYTKKPGDVSERVYVPIYAPGGKNYFGIDVTELNDESLALFSEEMDKIQKEKNDKVEQLMKDFDIQWNYRSFIPEKMSDIQEEEI